MLNPQPFGPTFRAQLTRALQKVFRRLRLHPAMRSDTGHQRALRLRRDVLTLASRALADDPNSGDLLPHAINQSALLSVLGNRLQVLIRRPHAREGTYKFSLPRRQLTGAQGYLLLCLDEQVGKVYVHLLRGEEHPTYLQLYPSQARQNALVTLSLSA